MYLVCWGVRGSLPTPGRETVGYGGHTSCVEVRTDAGHTIMLDAGTGARTFGRHLMTTAQQHDIDVFLTHFHWDHIQGLPFFDPFYDGRWTVRIHADPPAGMSVERLLATQMQEPFFPVRLQQVQARVSYHALRWTAADGEEPATVVGDVSVTPFRARHPGRTFGFRVTGPRSTIVYMPDNEPESQDYDVASSWDSDVIEFMRGADVLVHDAMFTDEEYHNHRGWGHGTFRQAVALAEAAHVPRLLLFHHAPHRGDAELTSIVARLQAEVSARGGCVQITAATEGQQVRVEPERADV